LSKVNFFRTAILAKSGVVVVQLVAVKKSSVSLKSIKNPSEKAVALHKQLYGDE
jgi:hypothetical protein